MFQKIATFHKFIPSSGNSTSSKRRIYLLRNHSYLEVIVTRDVVMDASTVHEVRITQAVDEWGRDLASEKKDDSFRPSRSSRRGGSFKGKAFLRRF